MRLHGFNRQRCRAQTEAERSTASTGQSAPRSGIKKIPAWRYRRQAGEAITMT
ncbi:hypothetical protein AB32_2461 [Escherichia coli 2-316-03_S1_C2]|nr:hypothetical protein AC12_2471 [Escherichia coli 2-005-03_S3_C2]KEJ26047.1 hypothetical protein AB03_2496 [Escherichia coli 2-316-03_S1_C1]KEJ28230.1 hypothetical protein AB32_2461 [Escherichia coli 2-316-03_S1_C2]